MSKSPVRVAAIALFLLSPLIGGCSALHARAQGFASDASRIQVVSTQVGGKNVFIPSTIPVAAGEPAVLSIYNTTEAPHGFAIPALGIREVIPVGEEFEIALPALEGPRLFGVRCHLHTAHRTATLLVLPTEDAVQE